MGFLSSGVWRLMVQLQKYHNREFSFEYYPRFGTRHNDNFYMLYYDNLCRIA